MIEFVPAGLGWLRDLPDLRDFHPRGDEVLAFLGGMKSRRDRSKPPKHVDLRFNEDGEPHFFSPVEDQGPLNCSTACAVIGLVDYFERRSHGRTFEGSTLFLYKAARHLHRCSGDSGAGLRMTLKALQRFGVPPSEMWHQRVEHFDDTINNVLLAGYARDFEQLRYVRLDARNTATDGSTGKRQLVPCGVRSLAAVKSFLAAGFPVAFGYSVPRSMSAEMNIPFRPSFDSIRGGQTVVAVGYDDRRATSPRGALLIRNSWGDAWGDAGYGWLPYAFVEQELAADFWTILRPDWIQSGEFHLPSVCADDKPARRGKSKSKHSGLSDK